MGSFLYRKEETNPSLLRAWSNDAKPFVELERVGRSQAIDHSPDQSIDTSRTGPLRDHSRRSATAACRVETNGMERMKGRRR